MVKKYHCIDVSREKFSFDDKKVIIWGLGKSAVYLYRDLAVKGVNVIGFVDSFTHGELEEFVGKKVYSYEQLKNLGEIVIYIFTANPIYLKEILTITEKLIPLATILVKYTIWGPGEYDLNLMKQRIKEDADEITFVKNHLEDEKSIHTYQNLLQYRLKNNPELITEIFEYSHPQYFPENEIIFPETNEIFVDAGAYDGTTSFQFTKWANKGYEKIYLMEPDSIMYEVSKELVRLNGMEHTQCVKKGAYSKSSTVSFVNKAESGSSHIKDVGDNQIETISIDELVGNDRVTFIKMDIEGAEMEALYGAQKTIERCKPKLAISIYHKEDDLWKIPYYVKKKYPWYRIYMRHYTEITTETILYATV